MWITTYSYEGHYILELSKLTLSYPHGLQTPDLTDFLSILSPTTTNRNTNLKFPEKSSLGLCRKSNMGHHIFLQSSPDTETF